MSFSLIIRGQKFFFDVDNLPDLCTNKSKSTAIIRWKLDDNNMPYHLDNNAKVIYLIDKIMKNKCIEKISFIDGNRFNYRKSNLKIVEDKIIYYNGGIYKVLNKIDGHVSKMGKSAGIMKNSIYKVINLDNHSIKHLLQCNDDYAIISKNSIEKVKKFKDQQLTWYKLANGYIGSHISIDDKDTILYLHQHLMDYYGHGLTKNSKTIDHINRDKLDNRLSNLRLATQSQQNQNTDKRKRKKNAKALPEGITQQMIPKYVVYYRECYNKEKQLYREFFKIEKHPKLDKPKSGSKSNKISIQQKLEEIKKILNKIDTNQSIETDNKLPVGIRLKKKEDKTELILDYRNGDNRYNLKMKCKDSKTFEENYNIFKTKVLKKYPTYNI